MHNMNSFDYLEKIKIKIFENLKDVTLAPSVELQDVPSKGFGMDDEDEDMLDDADEDDNPDVRNTNRRLDQRVEASGELSDTEDEDSGDGSELKGKRQRNIMDNGDKMSTLSDIDERIILSSPSESGSPSMAIESRDEDVEMTGTAAQIAAPLSEKLQALSSPSESGAEASPPSSPRLIVLQAVPNVEVTAPADEPSPAPASKAPEAVPKAGVVIPVPDFPPKSSNEPEGAVTGMPKKVALKKPEPEDDDASSVTSVNDLPPGATSRDMW